MAAIRTVIGALVLAAASCPSALAQDRAFRGTILEDEFRGTILEDEGRPRAPLAGDIDRQLRTSRGIEHELSLEQSRVNARSASALQRRQTQRDVQVSEQRLRTFKTESPQAPPIPLLERRLDRVSRPTGALSRDPNLESGASTSLGLSGSVSR